MLKCASCNEKAIHWCAGCKRATYCGKSCQSKDWGKHIQGCVPFFYVLIQGKKRTIQEQKDEEKKAESQYAKTYANYARTKKEMEQKLAELSKNITNKERLDSQEIKNTEIRIRIENAKNPQEMQQRLQDFHLNLTEYQRLALKKVTEENDYNSTYNDTMDNFITELDTLFGNMSEEARQKNKERHPCHNRDDIITQESLDKLPEDAKVTLYENNLKYCYDLDALLTWMRTSDKNPATNQNFRPEQLDIINDKKTTRLVMVLWPRWKQMNTVNDITEMRQLEELMHNAYGVAENTLESQRTQRLEKELTMIYASSRFDQLIERFEFLREALYFNLSKIKWENFDTQRLFGLEKLITTVQDFLEMVNHLNVQAFLDKNPKIVQILSEKFFPGEPLSNSWVDLRDHILFANIKFFIVISYVSKKVNIKRGESIRDAYINAFKQYKFPEEILPKDFQLRWLYIKSHWFNSNISATKKHEFDLPWPGEPKITPESTTVSLSVDVEYTAPYLNLHFKDSELRDILEKPRDPKITTEEIVTLSPSDFAQKRQNYWFKGLEKLSDTSMFELWIEYLPMHDLRLYLADFQQIVQIKDIVRPPWERVARDLKRLLDTEELTGEHRHRIHRDWLVTLKIHINYDVIYKKGIAFIAKNWTLYRDILGFTYSGFRFSKAAEDYGTKYAGIDWIRFPYRESDAKDWVGIFPTANDFSIAVKTSQTLEKYFWSKPFDYSDKPEFWSVFFKKINKTEFEKILKAKYFLDVNNFKVEVVLGNDGVEDWYIAYERAFKQIDYMHTLKIPNQFVIPDWIMSSSYWDVNDYNEWSEQQQTEDLPWPEEGPLPNEETGDYTLFVSLDYQPLQVKIKFSIPPRFKPYFFTQDDSPKMYIEIQEFMQAFQEEDQFQAKHLQKWFSNLSNVENIDKYRTRIRLVEPGADEDDDDNIEKEISDIRVPPYKEIWTLFNQNIGFDRYGIGGWINRKATIIVIVEKPQTKYYIEYDNITDNQSLNERVRIEPGESVRDAFVKHFRHMDLSLPDHFDKRFILVSSKWKWGDDWTREGGDLTLPWPRGNVFFDEDVSRLGDRATLEVTLEYVPPNIEFSFYFPVDLEDVLSEPNITMDVEELNQFGVEQLANRNRNKWLRGLQNIIDLSLYQIRVTYPEDYPERIIEDITQPPWQLVFDDIDDLLTETDAGPWESRDPEDWQISIQIEPRGAEEN